MNRPSRFRLFLRLFFLSAGSILTCFACKKTGPASLLPESCLTADSLLKESELCYTQKKYAETDSLAGRSAFLVAESGCNWITWAKARILTAKVIWRTGRQAGVQTAIDRMRSDLEFAEKNHPEVAGLFHLQLAYLYNNEKKEYLNALAHYEKARRLHEGGRMVVPKKSGQFLYKPLANIYTRLGENNKAVNLLQIARDSAIRQADTAAIPEIYCDLGLAFMDVGDLAAACQNYDTGLQFSRKNPGGSSRRINDVRTQLLSNWAEARWRAGDPDSASALAGRSLEFDPENTEACMTLGEVAAGKKQYDAADACFRRAEDIRRSSEYPLDRELAKILLRRARLAAERNLPGPQALGLCNEAIRFVIPLFHPAGIFDNPSPASFYPENAISEALDLKSAILWTRYLQGNRDPEMLRLADTTTALALQSVDTLTATYGFESSVLNSLDSTRALHERFFRILFERNERLREPQTPARIVAFSERSRALLLRQKLADDAALQTADISSGLAEREKMLRSELIEQKNTLAQMEADKEAREDIEEQKRRIFRLEDERGALKRQIRERSGARAGDSAGAVATLAGIRRQLPSDSAMLVEYFYNPETGALYLIGITRHEVRLARHTLAAANLEAFIAFVRDETAAKERTDVDPDYLGQFVRESHMLYDSLLAQVAGDLPLRELIVVPDGILGAFPFDLLLPGAAGADGDSFRQLPYLFRKTAVRFAASATVLLQDEKRIDRSTPEGYLGIAPAYRSNTFPWVEYGGDCVSALQALFGGQYIKGFSATKERFRALAPNCRILHFYGHGRADNATPGRSYLAFRSTTGKSAGKSGMLAAASQLPAEEVPNVLFAQEISLMHLNADLAVLSACETGVGKVVGGEGVLSLARAFLDAGCPSAAMTLWSVDDEATDQLTQSFLRHVREGKRKDIALQLAKKEFLESGKSAAPYYWSGFVLAGDANPLKPLPENCYISFRDETFRCTAVWAVGAMLAGVLTLLVAIFRYRHS